MNLKSDKLFPRFAAYGFLKNLRFFDPFIILIFREAGLSFLQIGLLYSIRDIATNILEIPTGVFADAFGRRKAMVMAFASYLISFIIFYLFAIFPLYALAMILFAFGEAFRSGTHKALILEHLKMTEREHLKVAYYGRTRSFSQLGSALNALIAAALVFYTGEYRIMFLAATIPYTLDLLNMLSYPKALDGDLQHIPFKNIWSQSKKTLGSFSGIFTNRLALRSILNSSLYIALFKSTKDYLQPILESFALSLALFTVFPPFTGGTKGGLVVNDTQRSAIIIGLVYFVIYLFTSYASRSAAGFSERFPSLGRAINLSFLFGATMLLVAGFATSANLTIISIIVFLIFYALASLRRPMNVAYISDQIDSRIMASGLSVEAQFSTILTAIFAPLLGLLADHFGVGVALAVLGAGVLVMYVFVKVSEKEGIN
ncbi:MAG: MFS transporter [Chloroflexi bacterium]|nr:MFS transporter [Chloroflexota bacterium]